jgi:hypothetical protein
MKDVSGQVNIIFDKEAESVGSKLGGKFYNNLNDRIWDEVGGNLNAQIWMAYSRVIIVLRTKMK